MVMENKWRHGATNFVFPLPDQLIGRTGCAFHWATFDPDLGEEVFLLFREEPRFVGDYSRGPITMLAHTGLVGSPHGTVAFVVWQFFKDEHPFVAVEQYLNPHSVGARNLVQSAANQSHFKLLVVNSLDGAVEALIDFENNFDLECLAEAMAESAGSEIEGAFDQAVSFVSKNLRVEDLILRASPGISP